ncbi:primosomal protein N' [Candidatus Contubernalis alkaliaceticus]|uniref:primosomal protein N' n=1 Tax=Candidatus Contubernalis alkaliaceticus TaxID=338645 RepID=UPI001F4BF228|nr:primosomal protein N' [Candidatus Contubernalis alkalaceticus]UNC92787.1 primosomal protein N' [Candidatus Contubernalis alkalaceticus]
MDNLYARVVVDLWAPGIGDRYFHYLIPSKYISQVREGTRVMVPFGNRKLLGFVMGFDSTPDVDKVKEIISVVDQIPLLTRELLDLARWISSFYISPLVEVLKAILPNFYATTIKAKEITVVKLAVSDEEAGKYAAVNRKRAPRQSRILDILLKGGEMSLKDLLNLSQAGRQSVKALQGKNLLDLSNKRVIRGPFEDKLFGLNPRLKLNPKQEEVLTGIKNHLQRGLSGNILLHGVTGSGKTEIYLQVIEEVVKGGKEALVLVPEISLTPQMVKWFRGRFGSLVTVLHSRLSQGERYDQWCRIRQGEIKIVIGPRSAVFAPFSNLGIIIIDEEHETTYKQEESPRYDARDAAKRRSCFFSCPVVLGSATPSVEAYYRAQEGEDMLLSIRDRVEKRPLPPVEVIDLKEEINRGNRTLFSKKLYESIKITLQKKQQVILFLNRRGFATFLVCRECGYVLRCSHCSITLTYHANQELLKCHYCHQEKGVPEACPGCGGNYIRFLGLGTQRVEKGVRDLFPQARILRMDVDATTRKGSHLDIFKTFQRGDADILIGTQMIAKGFDFPRVTLVGVILADTALNLPDFRAGERTFQLLTQVAGRTGRSSLGGKVIVQTFNPEHYSIMAAKKHDYQAFYQEELRLREQFQYPPYNQLVRVGFSSVSENNLSQKAGEFKGMLMESLKGIKAEVLGPCPCPLSKIRGRYRWHLVIKSKDFSGIHRASRQVWEEFYKGSRNKDFRVILDINPINML